MSSPIPQFKESLRLLEKQESLLASARISVQAAIEKKEAGHILAHMLSVEQVEGLSRDVADAKQTENEYEAAVLGAKAEIDKRQSDLGTELIDCLKEIREAATNFVNDPEIRISQARRESTLSEIRDWLNIAIDIQGYLASMPLAAASSGDSRAATPHDSPLSQDKDWVLPAELGQYGNRNAGHDGLGLADFSTRYQDELGRQLSLYSGSISRLTKGLMEHGLNGGIGLSEDSVHRLLRKKGQLHLFSAPMPDLDNQRAETGRLTGDLGEGRAVTEEFTWSKPVGFRLKNYDFVPVKSWKEMTLQVCEQLYQEDAAGFMRAVGTPALRSKFASQPHERQRMQSPRLVVGNLYFDTNRSAMDLVAILRELLLAFGLGYGDLAIFTRPR